MTAVVQFQRPTTLAAPSAQQGSLTRLLDWLEHATPGPVPSVMIVAAHPDDEVIGMGAQLPRMADVALVHVTDGAPRDLRDSTAGREEYAKARHDELAAALTLAGIPLGRARGLGVPDQAASLGMAGLTETLAGMLEELRPEVVITHAYEGGHPDHDASAFAVHAACALLRGRGLRPPCLAEMTSYHAAGGGLATSSFLPRGGAEVTTLALDAAARTLKQRLFACFATQQSVLANFPIEVERFRPAPSYDFERPPHEGRLYYEGFDWGVDGSRWRALAREALAVLGLSGAP